MRILVRFTLGFVTAALLLCCISLPWVWIPGLFLMALPLIPRCRRPWAALAVGLGAGLLWCSLFGLVRLRPVMALEDQVRPLTVTVTRAPDPAAHGFAADGRIKVEGRTYPVRLYLQDEEAQPGDRLRGDFLLKSTLPHPGSPGSYHRTRGIYLLAFPKGELIRLPGEPGLSQLPLEIRTALSGRIRSLFPEDTGPFAQALLLGETGDLDPETDWNLRTSGIRHVVAVSGLHVTILVLLVSILVGRDYRRTSLFAIPALVFFCAVTGFTPSVIRASVMMGLALAGRLIHRDYDSLTALACGVLTILIPNPLAVTSISFQLSVASVLGILTLYAPIRNRLRSPFEPLPRKPRTLIYGICSGIAMTFSAMVPVTPLCALYFGSVSLISPLTNLLTVWAMTLIFWGILLALGLSLLSMGAGIAVASGLSRLIRYVLNLARVMTDLPFSALYTENSLAWIFLILLYGLGFLCFLPKRKRPGLFLGAAALCLSVTLALSWYLPRRDLLRITMLDVGQGQSILLQSRGKNYLVDCGGSDPAAVADLAAGTLLSQGVRRLDGLILTHFDRDHVGAAPLLLQRVEADRIFLPPSEALPPDPRILPVKQQFVSPLPRGKIVIYGGETSEIANENSLCVLFEAGEYDILITGDRSIQGEQRLLRDFDIPPVTFLAAGHHGAAGSTGEALLSRVRPQTVLISAGAHNPYGHPARETLLRLRQYGCQILRTDLQGSILIRR